MNLYEDEDFADEEDGAEGDEGASFTKLLGKMFGQMPPSDEPTTTPAQPSTSSLKGGLGTAGKEKGIEMPATMPAGLKPEQMLLFLIWQSLQKQGQQTLDGNAGGAGGPGIGRSMQQYRLFKESIRKMPKKVVAEFLQEVEDTFGITSGQAYTLRDFTRRISWNRLKTLQRVHVILGEILRLLLLDKKDQAAAMTVQGMKSVHQCVIDQGSWRSAWLLTTLPGPCTRPRFGGGERERWRLSRTSTLPGISWRGG